MRVNLGEVMSLKGLRLIPGDEILITISARARHEFRNMDDQIGLRTRLEKLYGELCTFVHGGGMVKYNLSKGADNVPRFISDSFDLWYNFLFRVLSELTICYYVAYGRDSFDNLSELEIDNLKQVLLADHRDILEKAEIL